MGEIVKLQSVVVSSVLSLFAIGGLSSLGAQTTLSVDKSSLAFAAQQGGSAVTQTLNVTGSSSGLAFNTSSNASWLHANPTNGTTPASLTVTADPAGLGLGTVNGILSIFGPNSNTVQIQVTFTVGLVGVSPQSLQLAYTLNGSFPVSQLLSLTGPAVAYTATVSTTTGGNWLLVGPTSGQIPATLSVIVNTQVLPNLAAGPYSGLITITPANLPPITVPVTLTVSGPPAVTVNPAALTFNFQTGQATPAAQNVTVSVTPAQQLTFSLASTVTANPAGKNWLTVGPSGVTAANGIVTFQVAVDPSGLPANTYTGSITLTSQGTPASVNIPVTLVVSNLPLLNVPATTFNFTYQVGSAAPAPQPVAVTATSGTPIFAITGSSTPAGWLKVPAAGTVPTPFNVTVDPTGLAKGTYNGTVTVTGVNTGNGAQSFPVTLTVTNDPVISASVAGCNAPSQTCALSIPFQIGGTNNPGAATLTLSSSTGATLSYAVTPATTSCGNWLLVNGGTSAVSGTTSSTVSLSAVATGIVAGTSCAGTVTVTATNPATGLAAPNSPVTIPVTLTVSSAAQLVAAPTGFTFTVPVGGQVSAPQALSLTSTGSDQLNYTLAFTPDQGGNWLSLNATAGATPGSISLTATPSSLLAAGTYTGTLKITATGAGGPAANATAAAPFTIPVTLQLTAGTLVVNPTSLTFTQTLGAAVPATQALQITSNGQALNYTVVASNQGSVAWLSVTGTTTGQTPGSATVAVDGSKLSPGTYQGTLTVTAPNASNTPLTVGVTLTVAPGTISAAPATLNFTQIAGGTAPPAQAVAVSATPAALPFTVAATTKDGAAWLSATPASGTTNANVQVSVSAGSLAPGTYTGTVTITSAGAAGSPNTIAVTFTVTASQTLSALPAAANFSFIIGTANPPAQTVQVTSSGTNTAFTVAATTKDGATWLSATPTSGTTPASLSIQAAPSGLAAGSYTGTVTVSSANSLTPLSIPVTLTVTAIPAPVIGSIGNAASYAVGAVSPGENIVIFGTNIGPSPLVKGQLNAAGAVDNTAGDTQVFFDNVAAPMLYASAGQTSVMVPYGVAGRTNTTISIAYKGVKSTGVTFNVVASAPGIYTLNQSGTGPGAILNQDLLSVPTPATPAPKGSAVAVYMTGEGLTTGNVDGVIATAAKIPVAHVTATVGGIDAQVLYAGAAPGIVNGVMQVNVLIPANAPSGSAVPIVITVGGIPTQTGVTLAIQ